MNGNIIVSKKFKSQKVRVNLHQKIFMRLTPENIRLGKNAQPYFAPLSVMKMAIIIACLLWQYFSSGLRQRGILYQALIIY